MPALPGIAMMLSAALESASILTIACSLPPLPITATFILHSPKFAFLVTLYKKRFQYGNAKSMPFTIRPH